MNLLNINIYGTNQQFNSSTIQPRNDGKAKPYQIKQVRNLIQKYKLNKEL